MSNVPAIDMLVQAGLCPVRKLPYARVVLGDVSAGLNQYVYRDLAVKIYSKISNFILNDQILYQRMLQLLHSGINEMELDPHKREEGTASLRNTYSKDTPGQKTWKTIKRNVKK